MKVVSFEVRELRQRFPKVHSCFQPRGKARFAPPVLASSDAGRNALLGCSGTTKPA
jgi:hypothetical protein